MTTNIHVECDSLEKINYILSSSILFLNLQNRKYPQQKSCELSIPFTIRENHK